MKYLYLNITTKFFIVFEYVKIDVVRVWGRKTNVQYFPNELIEILSFSKNYWKFVTLTAAGLPSRPVENI